MRLKILFKEYSLLTNHPEVLHILDTNHHHILRNCKTHPIGDKEEASLLRIYHERLPVKKTHNRFIAVHREPWARTNHNEFGVSGFRGH